MKQLDNRGVTLIELIVGIAISGIVISSIAYLIQNSSRNYRDTREEVSLQMEAQTIINQLDDLIMEAYNVKYQDKELVIYQMDVIYRITLDTTEDNLYLEKVPAGESASDDRRLLGRYVKDFSVVDTGFDNQNSSIEITLNLKRNQNTYSIENHIITMRNRIQPVTN
ncbi:MAG: type II secretion system protein [Clostridiales bacterium]|nr:type II secretion system protein [Clostridiales bacterium]